MDTLLTQKTSAESFEAFWARLHGRICQFVCSRVSSMEDAEDILQDVLLRIYAKMGTVRDSARMESWAYQVARNRIIDYYRSRRQWVDLPETVAVEEETENDPSKGSLLTSLLETVHELPETYREAVLMADLHGAGQKDIAAHFGISLSGAKSRVQRGRQMVYDALSRCYIFEFDTRKNLSNYQPRCCC